MRTYRDVLNERGVASGPWVTFEDRTACDSDRSGEAGETPQSGSTEGKSAGLEGIARLPKRHLKAVP